MQAEKEMGRVDEETGTWFSNPGLETCKLASGTGVGKYLNTAGPLKAADKAEAPVAKRQKGTAYGNFDSW